MAGKDKSESKGKKVKGKLYTTATVTSQVGNVTLPNVYVDFEDGSVFLRSGTSVEQFSGTYRFTGTPAVQGDDD